MSKKQTQKTGNSSIVVLSIAVAAIIVFALWLNSKNQISAPTSSIQSTTGLDAAAKDLDNTDLNQIDTTQNQINSDTSNF